MSRNRVLAVLGVACAAALLLFAVLRQARAPQRPEYLLINLTADHDHDLALRQSLRLAEQKSGIENALVLLPELPPAATIEQLAVRLTGALHIGARRRGRGLLFLYSMRENLMKIEVSYALEGDIPDAWCHRLEEAAKTYMLSEVPQDFLSELIITANLRGMGSRDDAATLSRPAWLREGFLSGGAGAVARGARRTLADFQAAIARLPEAQLAEYAAAADPSESAQRYLDSLRAGVGDPRLPLLTAGSRIFRAVVPRNGPQQQRVYESFRSAGTSRLLRQGNLALLVPGPDRDNLPVVLRRGADGLWYVDEPKSWTWFHRYEDDVNFHVKYADNPFMQDLRATHMPNAAAAIYPAQVGTPLAPPDPQALAAAVAAGEAAIRAAPDAAAGYADLADLYLFEMDWIGPAIRLYERAQALDPANLAYRWRLMDLYLNDSRAEPMLEELHFLATQRSADRHVQDWDRAYRKAYDFDADRARDAGLLRSLAWLRRGIE